MTSITTMMTEDHRACDAAFVELESVLGSRDPSRAGAALAAFRAATLRHFRMEEDVLFPAFEDATGSEHGPSAVMRMEHEQMRALLAQLDAAVAAGDSRRGLSLCDSFMVLLQQHNMKEEQILYPMADQAVAAIPALIERMRAVEP